jgi:cytochrome c1
LFLPSLSFEIACKISEDGSVDYTVQAAADCRTSMEIKTFRGISRIAGAALLLVVCAAAWSYARSQNGGQTPGDKTAVAKKSAAAQKLKPIPRSEYIGDAGCAECHKEKFETYEKTAHHITSILANPDTVIGDFTPPGNTMQTANPNLSFEMTKKGDEFLQTAIWASTDGSAPRTHTEKLDIVIGSGGKGQNYFYWRDNQLFQLPAGYSGVLHRWIMSPGYEDGVANFERGIIPRCLECHATYFEAVFPDPEVNMYDTKNYVLGISCERCHGPGRQHAAGYKATSHGTKSAAPTANAANIVNPAKLSPARQADVCAQCHGGQGDRFFAPAFSYVAGQPLDKYIDLGPIDSAKDVDVHGKQGKLLMKSQCFQMSKNMNCSTCHDVHQKEPSLEAMSQHCLTCHKVEPTETHAKLGEAVTKNCVDCHMPTLESKVVYIDVDGKRVRPRFRTHWIKVYSEEERK